MLVVGLENLVFARSGCRDRFNVHTKANLNLPFQKEKVNKGYQEKAAFIKKLFAAYLGDYIAYYSGGDAAFYFYLTFRNIRTDRGSKFFNYLSRGGHYSFFRPAIEFLGVSVCGISVSQGKKNLGPYL